MASLEQRLRRIEEKVSSKRTAKKRTFNEAVEIDPEEYFEDGKVLTAQSVKKWAEDEDFINYMVEHQVSFAPKDILEIHIYSGEIDNFLDDPYAGNWPSIEEINGKIKLSSAYDTRQQDYIICTKAAVDLSNSF